MAKPTIHNIYVKVITGSDNDYKSRDITLNILKYLQVKMPLLQQMGVSVKINKVRSQDLQNPRLVEAIRQKGISRLPALVTASNVYIGFKDIIDVYESNIKTFMKMTTPQKSQPVKKVPYETNLEDFYKNEMTLDKANEDTEEVDFGEGADMMTSYRNRMEKRDTSSQPSRQNMTQKITSISKNNNSRSAENISINNDEAEIQETINRLALDIDSSIREKAFTASKNDSLDEGGDPQDDLMERAYWGSRVASSDGL